MNQKKLFCRRAERFRIFNRRVHFQIINEFQKIHSRIRITTDRTKSELRFRVFKNVKTPVEKLF